MPTTFNKLVDAVREELPTDLDEATMNYWLGNRPMLRFALRDTLSAMGPTTFEKGVFRVDYSLPIERVLGSPAFTAVKPSRKQAMKAVDECKLTGIRICRGRIELNPFNVSVGVGGTYSAKSKDDILYRLNSGEDDWWPMNLREIAAYLERYPEEAKSKLIALLPEVYNERTKLWYLALIDGSGGHRSLQIRTSSDAPLYQYFYYFAMIQRKS